MPEKNFPPRRAVKPKATLRHNPVSKTLVVDKAGPGHDGEPPQGQNLLPVNGMVQAHAVAQRIGKASGGPVLVLELISHRGLRPTSLGVVALIVEAGAVDVGDGVERSVDRVAERVHAAGLIYRLDIGAMQCVLEAGEAMLPA